MLATTIVNRLEAALEALLTALESQGARSALVGGLAVSARSEPRFTRDVDLAVAVRADDEAELVVQRLLGRGFRTTAVVEQERNDRLATVRVTLPGEPARGVVGDLLFASSGIEGLVVEEADVLEVFPGRFVPVARIGHLIALKLLSRDDRKRPQDRVDLVALLAVADEEEIERARSAVRRIEELGFARGRDLTGALEDWLAGG